MKRAAALLGVALLGSQAGHLLSYEMRFGSAAQQLQSTGAHAYFPLLVKTLLGAAAMLLIAVLLIVGFARLATGRKIERKSTPPVMRLLAGMYTLQLALFLTQETIEGSPAGEMLMWGLLGQLPVAVVGALALCWLLANLEPALSSLKVRCEAVFQLVPFGTAVVLWPAPVPVYVNRAAVAGSINRRGPPSF